LPSPPPSSLAQEIQALGASMSSTYSNANFAGHDFSAAMCIDGHTGSATGAWNFCMSNLNEANPWISLQLPEGSAVSAVNVYARADCCQRFLGTFQVWVGPTVGYPSSSVGMVQCGQLTAEEDAGPHTVTCAATLIGSVLTVLLPGTQRFLVLAEVVVHGAAGARPPLMPPPPPPPGNCPSCGCHFDAGSVSGAWILNE